MPEKLRSSASSIFNTLQRARCCVYTPVAIMSKTTKGADTRCKEQEREPLLPDNGPDMAEFNMYLMLSTVLSCANSLFRSRVCGALALLLALFALANRSNRGFSWSQFAICIT